MIKQYVKKIVSMNPTRFASIDLEDAIRYYAVYVFNCAKPGAYAKTSPTECKTFKNWLKTEI